MRRLVVKFALPEIAILGFVLWADKATGVEVSVAPLYLLVVGIIAWRRSLVAGVAAAVIGASGWTYLQVAGSHPFTSRFFLYENVLSRFVVLALVAYGIRFYKSSLAAHRERLKLLDVFVCACPSCGRFSGAREGWFWPNELLENGRPTVRYCPDCSHAKKP